MAPNWIEIEKTLPDWTIKKDKKASSTQESSVAAPLSVCSTGIDDSSETLRD